VDFRVIVVSVNDCLDPSEAVIDETHALHVKIAASRCARFNNVPSSKKEKCTVLITTKLMKYLIIIFIYDKLHLNSFLSVVEFQR
jgi:hypothetical protein